MIGFPLGHALFGPDVDLSIVISGAERGAMVRNGSVRVTDSLSQRSTCDIQIFDPAKNLPIRVGQTIHVRWHGSTFFGGTIDRLSREINRAGSAKTIKVSCVDFAQLLDRFHVAYVYEGMTLGAIVRDIVMVRTLLWREGISLEDVQEGPVIKKASFNYHSVTDCFRDLAQSTGHIWNMTPGKVLQFVDQATFPAPYSVDDGNPIYDRLTYDEERKAYRNRQILRGGVDRIFRGAVDDNGTVVGEPQYFRGDAASVSPEKRTRSFTLDYPLWSVPIIKRNGVTQRMGVKGKDKDGDLTIPSPTTWAQLFWQRGEAQISQNSASDEGKNPTLALEDVLEVRYVGEIPLLIDSQRDKNIAERSAVEGGTGIYESVDQDDKVDGWEIGAEKAERLLDQFGRIPNTLKYQTDRSGLGPGQLQTETIAEHGINGVQFLIDQIQITFLAGKAWRPRYMVTALDGQRQGGWTDWFRRLIDSGKPVVLNENEVPTLSRKFEEQILVSDSAEVDIDGTLDAYTADPYSVAWVGVVTAGSRTECAWVVGRSIIGAPYVP